MLQDRGLSVTYQTIRNWCQIWGPVYARGICQKRGSVFKGKWHIDEVKVKGDVFWICLAIGMILLIYTLLQPLLL
ncbi:IS6 family transposase [Candidatus Odyssella acanthamoebae]|uniref:Transposase n=1 Tax=Candidatus Odyssella acanthamoebae TaxID=91604 RepID=A0A077AVC4_9PROT|nr:IS6 family transposase [Candidatus Paracaedibacter acanthamoebae]AIK97112.1 hypothetical protein ID47_10835 [Candidatus Paracaedibacter acanthamoebae]